MVIIIIIIIIVLLYCLILQNNIKITILTFMIVGVFYFGRNPQEPGRPQCIFLLTADL